MRILALSDIHGFLPKYASLPLPEVDRIMIAGDVCPIYEDHSPEFQKAWLENVFAPWVEHLKKPVYFTLGNHDLVDDFQGPSNLRFGTETIIDDVLLFSWTPEWPPPFIARTGYWQADETTLAAKLEAVLNSGPTPPIWLTHSPPWGALDLRFKFSHDVKWWHILRSMPFGSRALRDAAGKYRPKLLICGHVHACPGQKFLGDTLVYNVCILDVNYALRRKWKPRVIEFPEQGVPAGRPIQRKPGDRHAYPGP